MEKEETQNKKNQNLKDENSDLSKDKKALDLSLIHISEPTRP